jgi:NADPH2 dehydrogenase
MMAALFSEIALGGLTFPNRIAVAPMGQNLGRGGLVRPWHLQQIGSLAVSGPGMVIMESATMEPEGAGVVGALALYSDEQEAALAELISAIRTFSDTRIGIQIVHWGRKVAMPQVIGSRQELGLDHHRVYAPSALSFGEGFPMPEELDQAGLDRIKRGFAKSAERAARAGIDVLELHAAHGFLLHEFYSPRSNQRTDGYGGSRERRIRYPIEVAEAVRAVWPKERTLGIRLNCIDYVSGPESIDEAVAIGVEVARLGYDYICCAAGSIVERSELEPPDPGYLVPVAARMQRETGIPAMVVGVIIGADQAEEVVASGEVDLVGIARAFIDDPRWVWHAAARLGAEVPYPRPYQMGHPSKWPAYRLMHSPSALGLGWAEPPHDYPLVPTATPLRRPVSDLGEDGT